MKPYQRPEMEVEQAQGEIALLESDETPVLSGEEEDEEPEEGEGE